MFYRPNWEPTLAMVFTLTALYMFAVIFMSYVL